MEAGCSSSNKGENNMENKEEAVREDDILPGFQKFDAFRQVSK